MPLRAVESFHWQLGDQEISRRATSLPLSQGDQHLRLAQNQIPQHFRLPTIQMDKATHHVQLPSCREIFFDVFNAYPATA